MPRVKGANRLIKVQKSADSGAVVVQTSEFDATGRRMKKTVTNSGVHNGVVVYLYDGHKALETRNGSNQVVQQFVHGTQYVDEVVMTRVKDKGDLYVHQDANWNVLATTDQAGRVAERWVYRPYGEFVIHQASGFGDRDGDGDVDATDKGSVGTTCTGTVSGSCRVLDLDFDGDYDASDATKFDSLPQGLRRSPGRTHSALHQPFAHQGLLFEPEIASYQNRARQYDPGKRGYSHIPENGDDLACARASRIALSVVLEGRLPRHGRKNSPLTLLSGGALRPPNMVCPGLDVLAMLQCASCASNNDPREQANDATQDWRNTYCCGECTADNWTCMVDAMQHCIGSCIFARMCGRNCAIACGILQEIWQIDMSGADQTNNAVGADCQANTEQQAVSYCQQQLEAGNLDVTGNCE